MYEYNAKLDSVTISLCATWEQNDPESTTNDIQIS